MVRSKRTAFTLVELLVVITIIGMLMALLLPAVGAATEAARAAQCKNRVKQIALAMTGYESRNQAFPGYVDGREVGANQSEVPYSWLVAIMPDMERQDIYDAYDNPSDFQPTQLDFLICPSDPPLQKDTPYTSYVANAGFSAEDAPGCGILHTALPVRSKTGQRKKLIHKRTSLDKIAAGDGATNTILLSENVQASTWSDLSFYDGPQAKIPDEKPDTPPHNVIVWSDVSESNVRQYKINSKQDTGNPWPTTVPPTLVTARPSSEHRGGVNVAFADGHVQFMKDSVDYVVYARLLSPDGKKCDKFLANDHGSHSGHRVRLKHDVIVADGDYK